MNLPRRVERLEQQHCDLQRWKQVHAAPLPPLVLSQPSDVLALLSEQVNAVRADAFLDPLERARTLGFLSTVLLRTLEARDVDARLEAVERVLKLRKQQEREIQRQQARS